MFIYFICIKLLVYVWVIKMKLNDLIDKYIIIEKRDGKKIEGILIDVRKNAGVEEDEFYTTLIVRISDNKYKNVSLIEVESIGSVLDE